MDQVFCYPKVNLRINPLIQLENKMDFWQNPYLLNGSVERYENSTPLASKVRCSISVLGNSSTSVIFQSPTPVRVRGGARGVHLQSPGVQHRFVGGAKGVHPLALGYYRCT